jgi:SAM-dependent methyltransferase
LRARRSYFRSHEDDAWPFVRRWLLSVDKRARILDVGCGGGDDLEAYAALGFEKLFGIDPVGSMVLEASKNLGGRATVETGEWQSIPYPNQFFSTVIGRYSLHYLRDLDHAFAEAHRSLKPGGLLLFVVSHPLFDAASRQRTTVDGHPCIQATVYGRRFEITYFCHTLSDYFSKAFLRRFQLIDWHEFTTAIDDQEEVPSGLAIAARRRPVVLGRPKPLRSGSNNNERDCFF